MSVKLNLKKVQNSFLKIYEFPFIREITPGSVEIWAALPHEIRRDPSLVSFRQHHQRLNGNIRK